MSSAARRGHALTSSALAPRRSCGRGGPPKARPQRTRFEIPDGVSPHPVRATPVAGANFATQHRGCPTTVFPPDGRAPYRNRATESPVCRSSCPPASGPLWSTAQQQPFLLSAHRHAPHSAVVTRTPTRRTGPSAAGPNANAGPTTRVAALVAAEMRPKIQIIQPGAVRRLGTTRARPPTAMLPRTCNSSWQQLGTIGATTRDCRLGLGLDASATAIQVKRMPVPGARFPILAMWRRAEHPLVQTAATALC